MTNNITRRIRLTYLLLIILSLTSLPLYAVDYQVKTNPQNQIVGLIFSDPYLLYTSAAGTYRNNDKSPAGTVLIRLNSVSQEYNCGINVGAYSAHEWETDWDHALINNLAYQITNYCVISPPYGSAKDLHTVEIWVKTTGPRHNHQYWFKYYISGRPSNPVEPPPVPNTCRATITRQMNFGILPARSSGVAPQSIGMIDILCSGSTTLTMSINHNKPFSIPEGGLITFKQLPSNPVSAGPTPITIGIKGIMEEAPVNAGSYSWSIPIVMTYQ
ncbi:hypothetical protein VCSRO100_0113 [Vibrio cholerae]|nr:hypothetical protein VCSRO100_0113 [Vibrio cholerae]